MWDKTKEFFGGEHTESKTTILRGNEAGQYNTKRALEVQAMRIAYNEAEKQKKADQEKNYILDQQRKKIRNDNVGKNFSSSAQANE